ncbi:uncharacterized protein FPOAC1_013462 [Fusarium poae]|uniref:uncharacterized protein n=1 Tax=Fusarium poae TaxID=36050 RepID=UPI001D048E75|nr:uncharacterized protein FPOAC1_013462 [Fusarium poae]KAG8664682.1 hypothetical protein FPOAC1_013462 [Fusarium poae]
MNNGKKQALKHTISEDTMDDRALKTMLSRANQFNARPRRDDIEVESIPRLSINETSTNEGLSGSYFALPEHNELERSFDWCNWIGDEMELLWRKGFSSIAQGRAPPAVALQSMILLACDDIYEAVLPGFDPMEITHLKTYRKDTLEGSARDELRLMRDDDTTVVGDIQMGFETPEALRTYLKKARMLVNVVEIRGAKAQGAPQYHPTFILDTRYWSVYIYFPNSNGGRRTLIVNLVASALRQMLAWAGIAEDLHVYAPPISPVDDKDVFGQAIVGVFMIFLTLRGWTGVDFDTVIDVKPDEKGTSEVDKHRFPIPQRDWLLGKGWNKEGGDNVLAKTKGPNVGVRNVAAFLGTVICNHLGLHHREYRDGTDVCNVDDWTQAATSYDPPLKHGSGYTAEGDEAVPADEERTNLGMQQYLRWHDVPVHKLQTGEGQD